MENLTVAFYENIMDIILGLMILLPISYLTYMIHKLIKQLSLLLDKKEE